MITGIYYRLRHCRVIYVCILVAKKFDMPIHKLNLIITIILK